VWTTIGYTGLSKSDAFAIHAIHLIDAGIISYQPWTDNLGAVHPFREYGLVNQVWNSSNINDGYLVESYNFSNIPNVVSIEWDFQTMVAKVQNGVPAYEYVYPNFNGPVYPFDRTNFQIELQSLESYHAQWQGNSTIYDSVPGNLTLPFSNWDSGTDGLKSDIDTNIMQLFQELPKSLSVAVNFTATWHVQGTIVSPDAGLRNYNLGFDRSACVLMIVRNETVLSAAGSFYVHTTDTAPVQVTYRTVSLSSAFYATIGIVAVATIAILVMFTRELRKTMRRLTGRGNGDETLPAIPETPKSSPSLG
jgi:hypothetical protein